MTDCQISGDFLMGSELHWKSDFQTVFAKSFDWIHLLKEQPEFFQEPNGGTLSSTSGS